MLNNLFSEVFNKIPLLGTIHLAGNNPISRALDEILLLEEEGIDGAIIANYHGTIKDVEKTLHEISKLNSKIIIGVNIFPNEFAKAFEIADKYGARFIQLDHVAGKYIADDFEFSQYKSSKKMSPHIIVLGGVWPKYLPLVDGSNLKSDVEEGIKRAEAIVVTAEKTGRITPLDKINKFRKYAGNHPIIIGADLTPKNAYEQLSIADGAILAGTIRMGNDTPKPLDTSKIRDLAAIVKLVRANRYG